MLSDEEKRLILDEEAALYRAEHEARQDAAQQRARVAYRDEVRAALRFKPPRPLWAWAALLLWVGAAWRVVRSQPAAGLGDTAGGIASSSLIERCERQMLAQLGQLAAQFPDEQEAARQISAADDGKRWNGWVESGSSFSGRAAFGCQYSAAADHLQLEFLNAP